VKTEAVQFYEQYDLGKLYGFTPSIASLLAGVGTKLDSFTSSAYAQFTVDQYRDWLSRPLASAAQVADQARRAGEYFFQDEGPISPAEADKIFRQGIPNRQGTPAPATRTAKKPEGDTEADKIFRGEGRGNPDSSQSDRSILGRIYDLGVGVGDAAGDAASGGEYSKSGCGSFDLNCQFRDLATSDTGKDVAKRFLLILAALLLLGLAILSLR
jgi:hypothetical protein